MPLLIFVYHFNFVADRHLNVLFAVVLTPSLYLLIFNL